MNDITIRRLEEDDLRNEKVFSWPVWEKEVSEFSWIYSQEEACYIVEGKATVTPNDGRNAVTIEPGDYVVFPAGMECVWEVHEDIKKHFSFR